MLAMMLLGTAIAQDSGGDALRTLSCSVAAPSWTAACFIEQPVATFGSLEVAVGVDARAVLSSFDESSVAGYAIVAWYEPTWSAWLEVATPEVAPMIGRADALRAGFTTRF